MGYRVAANAGEITGGTAGNLRQVNAVGGLLAFNPDGSLDTTAPTATLVTAIGPIAWANGAARNRSRSDFGFTGTSQFALPSSVS